MIYRFSNYFYNKRLKLLAKILWRINRIKFNVDIDYRAKIGKGFCLVHGLGVVIGHEVRIGNYVTVYQGVTIGGNNGKNKKENDIVISQPIIKDNVIIYSNANIIGPVKIGNDVIIGMNTMVNRDIPDNKIYYCSVLPIIKERK